MNRISIQLKDTSQPIEHTAVNTYEKGSFFCVFVENTNVVYKYPIDTIFRVVEDYGYHGSMEGLPKDEEAEVPSDLSSVVNVLDAEGVTHSYDLTETSPRSNYMKDENIQTKDIMPDLKRQAG